MDRKRAGAVAWVASAVVFPAQLAAALAWPDGYSLRGNAISDLGVTVCGPVTGEGSGPRDVCSPWHAVFNGGMIASGLLIAVGAVLLFGHWRTLSGRAGMVAMAVTGLFVAAVGMVPWDRDPGAHDAAATSQAVSQWVAMGLLAAAAGAGVFRRLTLLALAASVAGFVMFLAALDGAGIPVLGFGGSERLAFDVLALWTALAGAALLARPGHRAGNGATVRASGRRTPDGR